MKKQLLTTILAAGAFAGSLHAAAINYTYLRQFDTGASGPRMTVAIADSTGGIYFGNNNNDRILYIATPLTATSTADAVNAYDGSTPTDPYGSGSWTGLTIDPNGTLFATGSDTNPQNVLMRITGPVGSWTPELITLPSIPGRIGGCSAVGVNKIVVTGYDTGQLHFLTISGSSATLDGSTAAIPSFSGLLPACVYDAATSKIFCSYNDGTSAVGGVRVFDSNGTVGGTTYNPANNPVVAVTTGIGSSNSFQYQSISYNSADKIIITNRNNAAVTGGNGWQLIDYATPATNIAPYQFLDNTGSTVGQLGTTDNAMGQAFFSVGGSKYIITGSEDSPRDFTIYQQVAAVSDWSVY